MSWTTRFQMLVVLRLPTFDSNLATLNVTTVLLTSARYEDQHSNISVKVYQKTTICQCLCMTSTTREEHIYVQTPGE